MSNLDEFRAVEFRLSDLVEDYPDHPKKAVIKEAVSELIGLRNRLAAAFRRLEDSAIDYAKLDAVVHVLGIEDSEDDPSEVCKQIMDRNEELQRARNAERPAYGWLIEDATEDGTPRPRYYNLNPNTGGFWTTDHDEALRFARKVDAEWFCEYLGVNESPINIVEHGWG